jgi:5-(carboxyamino)imidazole ribonucleotide synthase
VTVRPGAGALLFARDKRAMRERLGAGGVPVPRWAPVRSAADLDSFAARTGWPVVVKAERGGHDGRGVWFLNQGDALPAGVALIVEERVPLRRELAAVVARSPFGQVAAYPVVETVRHDGIRVEVLAPAPGLCDERAVRAQDLAIRIATELDVVGLLAVELFDTGTDLIVNELAMRPHASAHWTVEGARTSQFEQHLRAVLDYPMGDTSLTAPFAVTVNVRGGPSVEMSIDERLHHTFAAAPSARIHLYGADAAPDRAIGHVTVLGDDFDQVRARARSAAVLLRDGPRKATAAGG